MVYLWDRTSYGCNIGTLGKSSKRKGVRKGAWILFCGVFTHDSKDLEFQSLYEIKNYFYFLFKEIKEGLAITFDILMAVAMA